MPITFDYDAARDTIYNLVSTHKLIEIPKHYTMWKGIQAVMHIYKHSIPLIKLLLLEVTLQ